MATSGSTNFTQNRTGVIEDALQLLNVYGRGKTVSAEDMAFANRMLNKMIKAWQGKGIHLWTMDEGILFPTTYVGDYALGASGVKAAKLSDTVMTKLNGAHTASDTTITVDSTTGMLAADTIGIVVSDNTVHWTTIVSVDSSTTLTLTAGLSAAANDNANIYTYTTALVQPLKIHNCRRVYGIDESGLSGIASETQMRPMSQDEFDMIAMKGTVGAPNAYTYTPALSSLNLRIWPMPDIADYYIKFRYSRKIEDMDATTDNFDFPDEWLECLTYQLALRIAPPFGKADLIQSLLAPMASQMLEDMLAYDNEVASINFSPSED